MDYLLAIGIIALLVFLFSKELKTVGKKYSEQKEQYNKDVDRILDECGIARESVRNRLRKVMSEMAKTQKRMP